MALGKSEIREVILIDFNNMLYSEHFAHPTLTTSKGVPTGAIYGCLQTILSLAKKFHGAALVFCIDGKGKTWRHNLVPTYKANRHKTSELRETVIPQLEKMRKVIGWLAIRQVRINGLEADDVIGVLSAKLCDKYDVKIFSNDKDFYQLITKSVRVIRRINQKIIDIKPKAIEEEYGVTPKDWPKLRALMGDVSDNIKPLAGVGPVTAAKMIKEGVDPRMSTFKSLPNSAGNKFPQLKKKWKSVHYAYLLVKIPRISSYDFFTAEQKKLLQVAASSILLHPGKRKVDPETVLDLVLGFISEYELNSLIPRRHEFLSIP